MPRQYSLRYKRDLDSLFKHGSRKHSKHFTFIYTASDSFKIAYIISKKNAPKATSRNYSRRILKETIRNDILPNIQNPLHFALICKSDLNNLKKTIGLNEVKGELINLILSSVNQ